MFFTLVMAVSFVSRSERNGAATQRKTSKIKSIEAVADIILQKTEEGELQISLRPVASPLRCVRCVRYYITSPLPTPSLSSTPHP